MGAECAFLVDYELVPMRASNQAAYSPGMVDPDARWAEPDVGHAAGCLRCIAEDPALARARSARAFDQLALRRERTELSGFLAALQRAEASPRSAIASGGCPYRSWCRFAILARGRGESKVPPRSERPGRLRRRKSSVRAAVVILALCVAVPTVPGIARAGSQTVVGSHGAHGAAGGVGEPGAPGEDGGEAQASVTTTDATNQATVTGVVRSRIARRSEAPKQGHAGAPDAWIELDPAFAEALDGITAGSEMILLSWLHQGDRSVLRARPCRDPKNPITGVTRERRERQRSLEHGAVVPDQAQADHEVGELLAREILEAVGLQLLQPAPDAALLVLAPRQVRGGEQEAERFGSVREQLGRVRGIEVLLLELHGQEALLDRREVARAGRGVVGDEQRNEVEVRVVGGLLRGGAAGQVVAADVAHQERRAQGLAEPVAPDPLGVRLPLDEQAQELVGVQLDDPRPGS